MKTTYSLQAKAAPPLPPGGALPPALTPEAEAQTHEWAGDLYEQGDQSDPSRAFAAFQGADGETAWLDRADDGTLTGWVQDADGSVYRYSDDAAWAIDVDQAGMSRTDVPADLAGEPDDEGVEGDPAEGLVPEEDPAAGEAPLDVDDPELADDDVDADAVADAVDEGFAAGGADLPEEGEPVDDLPDPAAGAEVAEDPEGDEDEEFPLEGKSFPAPGGGRFMIRPQGARP